MTEPTTPPTGIEALVVQDIARRQQEGIANYGKPLAESGLSPLQLMFEAYHESLDFSIYLRAIIEKAKAAFDVEEMLVTGKFKGRPATACVKCGIRFPKRKNRCRVCGWLQSEELPAVTQTSVPSTEIP